MSERDRRQADPRATCWIVPPACPSSRSKANGEEVVKVAFRGVRSSEASPRTCGCVVSLGALALDPFRVGRDCTLDALQAMKSSRGVLKRTIVRAPRDKAPT
jgi:hypothetical protein